MLNELFEIHTCSQLKNCLKQLDKAWYGETNAINGNHFCFASGIITFFINGDIKYDSSCSEN